MRGIERRIERGEDPAIESVASVFVSRWDVAVADKVPAELKDRLGVAVAIRAYVAYRELLDSDRWQRLENEGARPQRLPVRLDRDQGPRRCRRRSTSTSSRRRNTVNTMPEETLLALAEEDEHRRPAARRRRRQRGRCWPSSPRPGSTSTRSPSSSSPRAPRSSRTSWTDLLDCIAGKAERGRGGRLRCPIGAGGRVRHEGAAGLGGARSPPRRGRRRGTCATCSPPIPTAASGWSSRPRACASTTRRTGSTDETIRLLVAARRRGRRCASEPTRCSRASGSTSPRIARCSTSRCGCRGSAR